MQSKETKLNCLVDKAHDTIVEGLSKRQERDQHSDREAITCENGTCAEVNDDDSLKPADGRLDQAE